MMKNKVTISTLKHFKEILEELGYTVGFVFDSLENHPITKEEYEEYLAILGKPEGGYEVYVTSEALGNLFVRVRGLGQPEEVALLPAQIIGVADDKLLEDAKKAFPDTKVYHSLLDLPTLD